MSCIGDIVQSSRIAIAFLAEPKKRRPVFQQPTSVDSMQITSDQIEAIRQGEPVRITSVEDGLECVVLRADIYDGVSGLLSDSLSQADVGLLIDRTMYEDDLHDPLLESYQKHRR